jgi:LysR family transcriptional regulator of abg operon
MRLNQIRFFLAAIESGSIRAAARKLGVSPPAITKSLRQLERDLHVGLVERTRHGVVATPAGRAFVTRARVVQSELRKAEEEFAQFSGGQAGSVAFGAGPTAIILIVPEALTQFRRQCPDAGVRIFEGLGPETVPLVRDQTLDFALVLRPEGKLESGLRFRPLFREGYVIAARKGHPLRNERSLAGLVDAQWLTFLARDPRLLKVEQVFSSAGLPAPRSMTRCDSLNSMVTLLARTDMLAPIGRLLLASPLARDALQQIPVAEPMGSYTHGMIIRADAPLTRVASAMAKAVIAVAQKVASRE